MNWYGGNIAEAITVSRKQNTIFVVYIEGQDEASKKLSECIGEKTVADVLGGNNFTAIKVEGNSITYHQFCEIYKQAPIPSIYFIGSTGSPLEIVQNAEDASQLLEKINNILRKSGKSVVDNFLAMEKKTETSNKSNESVSSDTPTASTSEVVSSPSTEKELPISTSELTAEEKIERAKELLEKKREAKKLEEEELQKNKEIERRKMGQDVQKLKKWQQEQELKNILEAREKEKQEEKQARQRVLDQIAQDKADRASRFGASPVQSQAQVEQPKAAKVLPNRARLQFKLPDGSSQMSDFESNATLMEVRNHVSDMVTMRVTDFALSTTFPRREFTQVDNTKTLVDLELVPNAVILVLPLAHGTVSTANQGSMYSLIWMFLTPLFSFFQYLKSFIVGAPVAPSEPTESNNQPKKRPSENSGETSRIYKKKSGETTVVHRQGNIHRLTDRTDSDDENNTWNGNSTQQM